MVAGLIYVRRLKHTFYNVAMCITAGHLLAKMSQPPCQPLAPGGQRPGEPGLLSLEQGSFFVVATVIFANTLFYYG